MDGFLNCQDYFDFDHGLLILWFKPALLKNFGIKQNSSPGQCFRKIVPNLLVWFKFVKFHDRLVGGGKGLLVML